MATDSSSFPPSTAGSMKVTQGLTSLFNQSIRRSRSMANLSKTSSDNMRSQSSLSVHQEEPEDSSSKQPTRTALESDSRPTGKRKMLTPTVSSTSVFTLGNRSKDGTRTPSPPARPAPAPRLWDDDELAEQKHQMTPGKAQGKSLAGLETSIAPREGSPSLGTMSPRGTSPRARMSPKASRERLVNRRKHSVTELTIQPMSTVQEQFESPNMAGMPRRSMSARESGRNSLTPRAGETDLKLDDFTDDLNKTPTCAKSHKSYRRSSMLLPGALAPLLIPNSPRVPVPPLSASTMLLPSTKYGTKSPVELSASPIYYYSDEKPPQVPPKSPRTLNRAFPVPRYMPQSAGLPPVSMKTPSMPSHTANPSISSTISASPSSSSPSTSHTASSSISSASPIELPEEPQSASPEHGSPAKSESHSAPAVVVSPLPWSMVNKINIPRKPLHNQNSFSIDETVSDSSPMGTYTAQHARNTSDSVINRGRPTRRGEVAIPPRSVSRNILKLASIDGTIDQMPRGWSRSSVMDALTREELQKLQQDAEFQAAGYETLPVQTAEDLTKELGLLSDHCLTLRRTVVSLRESRKTLHERLLAFLRAPGNALVSRDHILKQESSLSELDLNIDEWTTKLEAAQERHSKVQRKLLEHVSAILSLKLSTQSEEHTPPRSPVSADDSDNLQRLSYSIQVQALQEQRKRESEERRERLRQIEQMERENEELQEERRVRKASDVRDRDSLLLVAGDMTSPRASMETIQVYADKEVTAAEEHGVASLLASIEMEIDAMDRMRHA